MKGSVDMLARNNMKISVPTLSKNHLQNVFFSIFTLFQIKRCFCQVSGGGICVVGLFISLLLPVVRSVSTYRHISCRGIGMLLSWRE